MSANEKASSMGLVESIESRLSVRSFTEEDVPEKIVNEALRLAILAPSAGNLQSRDFIVVRNALSKKRLAKGAFGQAFIEEAPVVIVVCANQNRIRNYGTRGAQLYCLQDSAAAIEHILLYVVSQGFGSCWVGAFDEREVSKVLSIPDNIRPVAILPIGRPMKEGFHTSRLDTNEVVHKEKW
jgi:nitroreductase